MITTIIEYPFEETGEIEGWRYTPGDKFDKGAILGTFKSNKNESELKLISDYDGVVKNYIVNNNNTDKLNRGDRLIEIEYCTHEIQFSGLCATCGRELTEQTESLSILHGHSHLTVSHKEAQRIGDINTKRLIKERKLSLVLDLDHTLIHAVTEQGLNSSPNWKNRNRKDYDIHNITVNGPMTYCIKKRPHLNDFLENVNKNFELHIYTMGTRNYANEIAKLIDPDQTLFKERILSRDDGNGINFKTLQRLFPCDDSMVLIVDDRSDVWKKSKNLIQISPYVFFTDVVDSLHHEKQPLLMQQQQEKERLEKERLEKERLEKEKNEENKEENKEEKKEEQQKSESTDTTTADTTATTDTTTTATTTATTSTSTSTTIDTDDLSSIKSTTTSNDKIIDKESFQKNEEADCHLLIVLDKLTKIHDLYYKSKDKNEKPHVIQMVDIVKKEILKDQFIVFSGVYPLGTPVNKQPLRYLAEEFGASVENDITSKTTHVIAQRKGTSKVNKAISKGLKVVSPQWLVESTRIWQRADENDFKLEDDDGEQQQPKEDEVKATLEKAAENLLNEGVMEAFDDDAEKELEDFLDGESDLDSQGSSSNVSANSSDYENDDEDDDFNEEAGENDVDNNSNNSNQNSHTTNGDGNQSNSFVNVNNNSKVLKKRKRESLSSNSSVSSMSSNSSSSSVSSSSESKSNSSSVNGDDSIPSSPDSNKGEDLFEDDIADFLEAELDKLVE
ncbi:hypothetical protein DICPUDRAFT_55168 [Dictyostelium purpureum]|uniref:RNA polymerase II subunit A C-terminal domain phosphatase n=1 Tax=Dictyostelium purpureum TaxID=5786 RepID=F0ZKP4_DICPU|nr:uncharacterized protein DICPUDRAFT_55168 [Dictyostelium purpureum]EGC35499.1 hypothetical protein DICPUDRAFT_55168 [Dictyostelium purpureum]|eukprot:XP_003287978.1 hypothetical protein DICPUDRAFT_55168 [Dictyostelium purpureum]